MAELSQGDWIAIANEARHQDARRVAAASILGGLIAGSLGTARQTMDKDLFANEAIDWLAALEKAMPK